MLLMQAGVLARLKPNVQMFWICLISYFYWPDVQWRMHDFSMRVSVTSHRDDVKILCNTTSSRCDITSGVNLSI